MYRINYEDETFAIWLEPEETKVSLWKEKEPIFVCGRLMEPKFLSSIIGREAAMAPAVALDCSRAWEDFKGKPYIFLKKSRGEFVPGMVLLGLTAQERSKLNQFEEIETVRKMDQVTLRVGEREIRGISFFKR
jgi:Gamma-glutamyl cyclotransferase, AIG2-like